MTTALFLATSPSSTGPLHLPTSVAGLGPGPRWPSRPALCRVSGIHHGFRIGYDYSTHSCFRAQRNIPSALELLRVVRDYLAGECARGRILGPFPPASLGDIQVSPLGVVPKKGWNKWRLILDLSSPEGHSVNDGIPPAHCRTSQSMMQQGQS